MKKSLKRRWLSLGMVIAILWFFMGYALPRFTNAFDATRQLAAYIDESGIETGQFYYTGVEANVQAEAGARGSIAFAAARRSMLEDNDRKDLHDPEPDIVFPACP